MKPSIIRIDTKLNGLISGEVSVSSSEIFKQMLDSRSQRPGKDKIVSGLD